MKYSVTGSKQHGGERSTFIIEAQSEVDAVAQATARGYIVEQVLLVPDGGASGFQPNYDSSTASTGSGYAITALILGLISIFAWCLPICGLPITVVGVVFGNLGLKTPSRGMAKAGLILSIIGLVLTVINGAIGAYLGATGRHPLFKP